MAYKGELSEQNKPKRQRATAARLAALKVVRQVRERDAYAQDLIAKTIDDSDMDSSDRAFATRLVLGVVSCQGTLDEVIDRALRSPDDVQADVRDALRISTYEIVFLRKSPHAAVDQGVELARSVTPKAAGLANATLRKVVELSRAFPFGDPTRDVEALARLHAFPLWLAKRLIAELGVQDAVAFMQASNEPAPLFVAVNACKSADEPVEHVFARAQEELQPSGSGGIEVPGCYHVPDSLSLLVPEVKQLIARGRLLVSDASSQLVAASVLPNKRVGSLLEVGAGRATKTILLQSHATRRYGEQIGAYETLDTHAFKTKLLRERTKTYGVHVQEALTGDARRLDEVIGARRFDLVFIDAPCSGLGTLRRHPEIRWRLEERSIAVFARDQLAMLQSAAGHVSSGGTLAYATCTVTHEENSEVVKSFLASPEGADFKLVPIAGRSCVATRLSPDSPDAHFAVRFARK